MKRKAEGSPVEGAAAIVIPPSRFSGSKEEMWDCRIVT